MLGNAYAVCGDGDTQRDRDLETHRETENKYEDGFPHLFSLLKTPLDNSAHVKKLFQLLRASRSFGKTGLC